MYSQNLHFHFTGIGGSGMSGIAEILLSTGFKVSGSDLKFSAICSRLVEQGACIMIGHNALNVPEAANLLVHSSAISDDNPEIQEARRRNLPVIRRAEVLAELMRLKFGIAVAGSHGKTTTTSLISAILDQGKLDPTVIIGGIVQSHGSGARLGKGDFLVAESDESDRSFLLLKPTIAVVTNIDSEHLNAYDSLKELEESFEIFANSVPFYGLSIFCIDDQRVRDLAKSYGKRKITYGLSPDADIRAEFVEQKRNNTTYKVFHKNQLFAEITLPMPGKHLMLNSLAAIAVGIELEIDKSDIIKALESFEGVGRRSEILGTVNDIVVFDDYGHHPTEIKATLQAIKDGWKERDSKIYVVFQPHRYTRTQNCFVEFADAFSAADEVFISDIYSAGEENITGISSELLSKTLNNVTCHYCAELSEIEDQVLQRVKPNDIVVFQGAGTISHHARSFFDKLKQRNAENVAA
jgi:UDP-N-acetylmuramate--alanine ligase